MKRSHFIILSLSLLSPNVHSQFESADKKQKNEIDYSKLYAEIGKNYWIKANPGARFRIKFSSTLDQSSILLRGTDEFVVTVDLRFKVIGVKPNEFFSFLEVQFENEKIAYIRANTLWKNDKYNVLKTFDGISYSDDYEYLFDVEPDTALAAWRKNKVAMEIREEDERKRAKAEYEKKGGVRIGMTKNQVLNSNWGKPASIHKQSDTSVFYVNETSELWLYSGSVYSNVNILYFTNNKLTHIQGKI